MFSMICGSGVWPGPGAGFAAGSCAVAAGLSAAGSDFFSSCACAANASSEPARNAARLEFFMRLFYPFAHAFLPAETRRSS
ncbi:hypothetical protein D3C83_103400 [compost metagenome]